MSLLLCKKAALLTALYNLYLKWINYTYKYSLKFHTNA